MTKFLMNINYSVEIDTDNNASFTDMVMMALDKIDDRKYKVFPRCYFTQLNNDGEQISKRYEIKSGKITEG